MKIILPVLFFALFTAVLTQNTDPDNSTTSIETTPTTLETTTITTSDVSTTTSVTTTPSSTTISSTSTRTTEAPVTTSSTTPASSPVPTSVPPTKAPQPKKCEFNTTCIRAELQADFIVDIEGKKYPIILGCNASLSETDCTSNETQRLVLSESTYNLTMIFEKESNKVLAKNITFSYNLPEGTGVAANYSEDLFDVKAGNSYFCKSKFDIYLENVTMEVHEIHIQAFLEEGKNYGAIEECEADEKVSDIVPIAVGVALAALIIIVLIAYLVGRRRSRQKGYQSV